MLAPPLDSHEFDTLVFRHSHKCVTFPFVVVTLVTVAHVSLHFEAACLLPLDEYTSSIDGEAKSFTKL